jgi:hypothetical protein
MIRRVLLLASFLLLGAGACAAQAVGPVLNHCNTSWTASPATDIREYHVYFSATPGGVGSVVGIVQAPVTAWSCPVALTPEGQKYATVTAIDIAGNESPRSNEFPFVFDVTVPAAASNFRVQ